MCLLLGFPAALCVVLNLEELAAFVIFPPSVYSFVLFFAPLRQPFDKLVPLFAQLILELRCILGVAPIRKNERVANPIVNASSDLLGRLVGTISQASGEFFFEAVGGLECVFLGVRGEAAVVELAFGAAHAGGDAAVAVAALRVAAFGVAPCCDGLVGGLAGWGLEAQSFPFQAAVGGGARVLAARGRGIARLGTSFLAGTGRRGIIVSGGLWMPPGVLVRGLAARPVPWCGWPVVSMVRILSAGLLVGVRALVVRLCSRCRIGWAGLGSCRLRCLFCGVPLLLCAVVRVGGAFAGVVLGAGAGLGRLAGLGASGGPGVGRGLAGLVWPFDALGLVSLLVTFVVMARGVVDGHPGIPLSGNRRAGRLLPCRCRHHSPRVASRIRVVTLGEHSSHSPPATGSIHHHHGSELRES